MERTELNKKIGQNIRKYRLKIDISQENLAMSAGLYPAYLGRLERGEKCPTIDTLYKISCALGITINELICFDSKIDSSPTNNQAKMRIEEALKQIPDTPPLQKFYVLTKYYGVMRIMYSFVAANSVRRYSITIALWDLSNSF